MPNDSEFARRLRMAMAAKNFDETKVGDLVGVDRRTVQNWMNAVTQPVVDHVAKLCDALDVSADHLLGRPGYESPSGLPIGMVILDMDKVESGRKTPRDDFGWAIPRRPKVVSPDEAKAIREGPPRPGRRKQ